jgi:hypothetical protein
MQATHTLRDTDAVTATHTVEAPVLCATLDRWLEYPWDRGVQIDALEDLHALRVRTRNNVYQLAVVASEPGEVLVRGGRYFPEWTRVHFAGSSFGGACLKRYGLHVGLRMEFYWQGRRVITSPVHAIAHVECPAAATSVAC